MKDSFGREIDYMRISITDRCNYRCLYCMPDGCGKVSMKDILTYEEIVKICEAAGSLGITNFKITGGEPLARLGCASLVKMIKELPGTRQVTMTTNGELLSGELGDLLDAGLDAVNISIDSLVPERFKYITGGGSLLKVMDALDLATASWIRTKVNCLIQKGFNEDEISDFADFAFEKGIDVRFIEMMPIGFGDPSTGISGDDVLEQIKKDYPDLVPDNSIHGNGPAVYYHVPGQKGAVGLISAMHGVFCDSCNRIRLTSQGELRPCLCYEDSVDLRPALGGTKHAGGSENADAHTLEELICMAVSAKPQQHCFDSYLAYPKADTDSILEGTVSGKGSSVRTRPMAEIGG